MNAAFFWDDEDDEDDWVIQHWLLHSIIIILHRWEYEVEGWTQGVVKNQAFKLLETWCQRNWDIMNNWIY